MSLGHFIKALGIGIEENGHLIDKRTCTPRAGAVHTLLEPIAEVNDLCILSPEFNRDIGLWAYGFDGGGAGNNLLDKSDSAGFGQGDAS